MEVEGLWEQCMEVEGLWEQCMEVEDLWEQCMEVEGLWVHEATQNTILYRQWNQPSLTLLLAGMSPA